MRLSILAVLPLSLLPLPAAAETVLRVMSFNIWGGGVNEDKDVSETVAAIRAAGADIVGLQETRAEPEDCSAESCEATGPSAAEAIAQALGWQWYDQKGGAPALWANAVISRYPIGEASPHELGVRIDVEGRAVWLFNIHLDDEPYQPYQLLGIEYGPAPFLTTGEEAADWARRTRGSGMDLLEKDLNSAAGAAAVFVTGDFNEPSWLDWTGAAMAQGTHPVVVEWPATKRLADLGFTDAYRAVFPDPVAKPAFTWAPRYDEAATDDHPDRIDQLLAKGDGLRVTDAAIIGEDGPRSDIVVMPWPSDHRAVMAEFAF
ncbi:endonuclease/exonuclease/phosphatase family protein [Gemmobacter sp. 24YEA27]|uniref:endonuclease/exonuclease/phosphatase family protein n=1 Tax=Gemmobacter sp. 24YEA27 TaxID=3040672 RepID=UPI0024B349DE|nr:endonuclease/exonuclease/phosphatase family protein [Gemmobacter sp. 24YEA27]